MSTSNDLQLNRGEILLASKFTEDGKQHVRLVVITQGKIAKLFKIQYQAAATTSWITKATAFDIDFAIAKFKELN